MRSRRLSRAVLPAVVLSGAALFATSLHGIVDLDDRLEVAAAVQKQQQRQQPAYDIRDCDRAKPDRRDHIRDADRRKLRNKI